MSIASSRQSFTVWSTSGCDGISVRLPAGFQHRRPDQERLPLADLPHPFAATGRHFFAPAPQDRQRARDVPAPANIPHRRVEQRLTQKLAHSFRVQIVKNLVERETVRWTKRKHYRIFGGRGLQFEVELATKTLAQRQSPGAIETAAKRRMQHHCMLPLSSKNLSRTRLSCDGMTPRTIFAPARYSTICSAADASTANFIRQPVDCRVKIDVIDGVISGRSVFIPVAVRSLDDSRRNFFSQTRTETDSSCVAPALHRTRKESTAAGRALLNSHLALLHSQHAPRSVSELKNVALQTLDCKVFINRTNHSSLGSSTTA